MESKKSSKKTMGRQKIPIKKIEKKTSLQVTFTKRRHGLFRKACELVILSGAQVGILVQSPAEKIYSLGHPSVEAVINHVEPTSAAFWEQILNQVEPSSSAFRGQIIRHGDDGRNKYEEEVRMLEAEKMLEVEKSKTMTNDGGFWWEQPFDGLELHELEDVLEALEGLRKNVEGRAEEFEKFSFAALAIQPAESASSYLLQPQPFDQGDQDHISVQQVCDANSASSYSYLLPPFDHDQDNISVQQLCAADSASAYLLEAQPFDQDQNIFDVLNNY